MNKSDCGNGRPVTSVRGVSDPSSPRRQVARVYLCGHQIDVGDGWVSADHVHRICSATVEGFGAAALGLTKARSRGTTEGCSLPSPLIRVATGLAQRAHRGQRDKIGDPYIEHPAMVAGLVQHLPDYAAADEETQAAAVCAAWLHDTIEDTDETSETLSQAGMPQPVICAVLALTRQADLPDDDYYAAIRRDPIATLVKIADVASNLAPHRTARLAEPIRTRLETKYSHALARLDVDRSVIDDLHRHLYAPVRASHQSLHGNDEPPASVVVADLHSHSNVSDGTDTPRELVAKARREGVTVLALTDHDTTDGWAEAAEEADKVGLQLIRGIELTVRNQGRSQHLLAYEPDPTHPALAEILRRSQAARTTRIFEMVDRINAAGQPLTVAEVQTQAGAGVTGRPHVADALVARGVFSDRAAAFKVYLLPECSTYVARWAPPIEDALQVVRAAGGVPIVAHPWGRGSRINLDRFEQLKACGLLGVEVDHQEHDPATRQLLRGIATTLDLIITGSSDHHGNAKPNHDLGCNSTSADHLMRLRRALP